MIKQWWGSLPRGRRNMTIVMIVVAVLLVAAAVVGWTRAGVSSGASGKPPVAEEKAQGEDPSVAKKDGDAGETTVTHDGFEFEVDEHGMAVMPVTTDPREAAAGAAAVAFTADFSKLSREEFLEAAIARMTHPSEKYVGPNGEIHTLVDARPFEETQYYTYPPEVVMQSQVDAWATNDNPERFTWWTLANGATYENFALLPEHFWKAHPQKVLSEEEISQIDPSLAPRFPKGTDMEPDTPGASVSQWWVLSDVDNSRVGTADPTTLRPAHFGIWCDAPDAGGLCGVAFTLDASFPTVWPHQ
ncbi:hypothetical protein [Leucobacter chromiireducens]|nr:hypothetical protein [Leucobacter chromiireducens]